MSRKGDQELSLAHHFADVTDPRIDRSRLHETERGAVHSGHQPGLVLKGASLAIFPSDPVESCR